MEDVVLLCQNMANVKYFNGDLMSKVWRTLRRRIPSGQYELANISNIIRSLSQLNAYDQGVFHAAAAAVLPKIIIMSREQRRMWREAYQCFDHKGDEEFMKFLVEGPPGELGDLPLARGTGSGTRQVTCRLHGKMRSIDMMIDEGNGRYVCGPNKRCK